MEGGIKESCIQEEEEIHACREYTWNVVGFHRGNENDTPNVKSTAQNTSIPICNWPV